MRKRSSTLKRSGAGVLPARYLAAYGAQLSSNTAHAPGGYGSVATAMRLR